MANISHPGTNSSPEKQSNSSQKEPSREFVEYVALNSLFYGNIWLLEQIALDLEIQDDLDKIFNANIFTVNNILTLSFYSLVENRHFSRLGGWLKTRKTPSGRRIESDSVKNVMKSITDAERMDFCRLRLERQQRKTESDSAVSSEEGKYLVDINWNYNKDFSELEYTTDVIAFSQATNDPVYYNYFPDSTDGSMIVNTITKELNKLGIPLQNVLFTSARSRVGKEVIGNYVLRGFPFIVRANVTQEPVKQAIKKIEYNRMGLPSNMERDKETGLYCAQFPADPFNIIDEWDNYTVDGVTINLYLDMERRTKELMDIDRNIETEKAHIEEYLSGKMSYLNLREFNSTLQYHFLKEAAPEKKSNASSPDSSQDTQATTDASSSKYTISLNTERVNDLYDQCGFTSACMYHLNLTASEAYQKYLFKDPHEFSYSVMERDDEYVADRFTLKTSQGKSFVYFIQTILESELNRVWKENLQYVYEYPISMVDTMETIKHLDYYGTPYVSELNSEQLRICHAFGFDPPMD